MTTNVKTIDATTLDLDTIDIGVVKPNESFDCPLRVTAAASGQFLKAMASCRCTSVVLAKETTSFAGGEQLQFVATIQPGDTFPDNRVKIQFGTTPPGLIQSVNLVYHVREGLHAMPQRFSLEVNDSFSHFALSR